MASASIKSAVARIANLKYTELEELKKVKIPEREQNFVRLELKRLKRRAEAEKFKTPQVQDQPVDKCSSDKKRFAASLKLFKAGAPLKCVRIPKKEQRLAQAGFEQLTKNDLKF